jgi:hypothetical protein
MVWLAAKKACPGLLVFNAAAPYIRSWENENGTAPGQSEFLEGNPGDQIRKAIIWTERRKAIAKITPIRNTDEVDELQP